MVDRLFSRVGAGDDLARGRSTFMTEMIETAAILIHATPRSLVVLDEIGRGTATWDGLAIAFACAEALHETNRCRALFATHYHELATLEARLAHVGNLSMRAKEWNGDLVFLHEAQPGAADKSYGVQVARLAGVPEAVVARAREVLAKLEAEGARTSREWPKCPCSRPAPRPAPEPSAAEAALARLTWTISRREKPWRRSIGSRVWWAYIEGRRCPPAFAPPASNTSSTAIACARSSRPRRWIRPAIRPSSGAAPSRS